MYKRLLDTDTFSEIAKGFDKALIRKAERYRAEIGYYTISAITVMEIMRGFYRRKLYNKAEEFRVTDNEILLPTTESYFLAGKIHGELLSIGQEIGSADVLIASISLTY